MSLPFQGSGLALSSVGVSSVASALGVFAPEVWTVLGVETSGCGFIDDRRPKILYERHKFHQLTGGRFDDGDISDPSQGGYGPEGAHQYDRLSRAIQLDRIAALKSASWGICQVLGMNFALAGFPDVETMVVAMADSEDKQLSAVASFLISTNLHLPLRAHDWTAFARGYNGPDFARNHYDSRLNGEFLKCSVGPLPDTLARAAQLYLRYLGFHPGPVDGIAGRQTLAALAEFLSENGLPSATIVDDQTVVALQTALLNS